VAVLDHPSLEIKDKRKEGLHQLGYRATIKSSSPHYRDISIFSQKEDDAISKLIQYCSDTWSTYILSSPIPPTSDLFSTGDPPAHVCPRLVSLSESETIILAPIFQSLRNVCTQSAALSKSDLNKVYHDIQALRDSQEKCGNLPEKLSVKFDYYEVISVLMPHISIGPSYNEYRTIELGMLTCSTRSWKLWHSSLLRPSYTNHQVYFKNNSFPVRIARTLLQVILCLPEVARKPGRRGYILKCSKNLDDGLVTSLHLVFG
jgi:hypothetical protein